MSAQGPAIKSAFQGIGRILGRGKALSEVLRRLGRSILRSFHSSSQYLIACQSFIMLSMCSAKNSTPVKEEEKERRDASPAVLSVETKGNSWFSFLAILFPS